MLTGEGFDLLRGVNDNIHANAVDSMLGHVVGDRLFVKYRISHPCCAVTQGERDSEEMLVARC